MNEMGLGMVFSAKDLATGVMGKVSQHMLSLTGQSTKMGVAIKKSVGEFTLGMSVMGAGIGLLGGAVSLANVSGEFSKELASVGAIAQATADDMKVLHDAAIEAGIATQFSPKEAAAGLGELAQAGYNATESTKLLIPTLDLAAGGQISVAQAASTMSSATKVFGLSIDQAAVATDKLLAIANATSLGAGDLQLSLGNVARGAVATGQSLDEMLPAMGLVKNTGVAASVASSAVSSALLMVAKNAGKFKSDLGVQVTDAAGNFKPLMDIILATDAAMSKKFPNAAERSAKAMELFGNYGLTAFSGIAAQLKGGITGSTGQKLFGAEAVADLRNQMAHAEGAAAKFRDRLLDTFEGQKTLLKGSVETMAILLGEPFERALKPIVKFVLDQFNRVLAFVKAMPDGMKDFIAKVVLGAGAVLTLVGGLVAAKATIAMVAYGMSALGVTVGSVLATLLPMVAVLGALVGVAAAVKYAIDNNIGGAGDTFKEIAFNVGLFVDALGQLFTEGGLSGDAMTGFFNDSPAVNFAIKIYVIFNRVKEFVDQFVDGVKSKFEQMGPTFDRVGNALTRLGKSLGIISESADVDANTNALQQWGEAGLAAGEFIGDAIDWVVKVFAAGVDIVNGFVENFDAVTEAAGEFTPIFEEVGDLVMSVLADLGLLDGGTDDASNGWRMFGSAVASVLGAILSIVRPIISSVVSVIRGMVTQISGFIDIIAGIFTGDWDRVWRGFKKVVAGAVQAVLGMLAPLAEYLAMLIDGLGSIAGKDLGLGKKVRKDFDDLKNSLAEWADFGNGVTPTGKKKRDTSEVETMPPEPVDFYTVPESQYAPTYDNVMNAEAEAAGKQNVDVEGLNASIQEFKSAKSGATTMSGVVNFDGDAVGTFVANAQNAAARAGGRPAPTR